MSISFDRVADIYDDTRRMPDEVVERVMDAIGSRLKPASSILEIGIGTGRMAIPLAQRGFLITGIDISDKMLAHLRKKSAVLPKPIHAVRGNIHALPFVNRAFDAVLAVHVLHLVDDIDACLREVHRVLRAGGKFFSGGEQRLMRHVQQVLREEYDYGIEEDLVDMLAELGVRLPDQDVVERRIEESARALGAQVERLAPIEWDYDITCADIVGRIEGRVASYLWSAPEEGLKKLVEKLKTRLESSVGPPSTTIRFRRGFRMLCARFEK